MKRYKRRFSESNDIKVVLNKNKTIYFSKKEIKELIDTFEDTFDSDNLSKWIYRNILLYKRPSLFDIKGSSKSKIKNGIKNLLIQTLKYQGQVIINVQSDEFYKNGIEWK